ncbi:hypothetical protein PR048_020422 [Dryococelus australis]|uniref:Uncharacterized protein n=1 Tax=Dryococelus australis TaxID=614101 RepID=A0ABQ9H684_9NEOP|nr:hypothetical protein PR048_020422 [Dryococelus australis]
MSLNAKFNGGKRINFGKRDSYYRQCYGTAFAQTSGPGQHDSPWKKMHGLSPGSRCKKLCQQHERKCAQRKLRYQKDAWKKKRKSDGGPDENYGDYNLIPKSDIYEEMISLCDRSRKKLTQVKREALEEATRGKHDSENWHELSGTMITHLATTLSTAYFFPENRIRQLSCMGECGSLMH